MDDDPCGWAAPARPIRKRFDEELTALLLETRWWDFQPAALVDFLPTLCDENLERVRKKLKEMKEKRSRAGQ